ncbi:hypothetical protein CWI39_0918p0030 [Hamiltosporidium magnivora]|uniref:Uncharacterized protein n=1 Tax=Hamiltosporidium magnivora TaxID=148818 RepID=A0A4Q9L7T1_9MICR|nr:hypothetical protein CWI39_0918p0030 [Hamiltosporidium magnivora]
MFIINKMLPPSHLYNIYVDYTLRKRMEDGMFFEDTMDRFDYLVGTDYMESEGIIIQNSIRTKRRDKRNRKMSF